MFGSWEQQSKEAGETIATGGKNRKNTPSERGDGERERKGGSVSTPRGQIGRGGACCWPVTVG